MLFAGIDIGSLTAEAVVIDEKGFLAYEAMNVLPNPLDSAKEVVGRLLEKQKFNWEDIKYAVSTGYGREHIQQAGLAQKNVSEISCHGLGAFIVSRDVRTIIDIGGQDAKVIKVSGDGELVDFVMNDKCAAGTGQFLEVMSKALDVGLEELGPLAQGARNPVEMSSRCSIYVETEVLHYLQRGTAKKDIAGGIARAMAERVVALARRVGVEKQVMMTGGVAKNIAVRNELEKSLKVRMVNSKVDPQIIGAYGAATFAKRAGGEK